MVNPMLKVTCAFAIVVTLGSQAFADGLANSAAAASQQQAAEQQKETAPKPRMSKAVLVGGTGLFAAGMGAALYGFLHNQNTGFPGYRGTQLVLGEATATNKVMGLVGLGTAFAGGTVLFLGQRHAKRSAMSITVAPGQLAVARQVSWP